MAKTKRKPAYIHGTEPSEQARLAELNRLTNREFVAFLRISPGMRILEVGSGLGILAADVAASGPEIHVTGIEISAEQIRAAPRAGNIAYLQGDAHELEFADGSFDLVYARYLLEHVAKPERVVAEMRRVARNGGRVALQENDIGLLRVDPPCPAFDRVWKAFARYQRSLGGDALIGSRLFRLLRTAGFTEIELSMQPETHWHGSPGFGRWIENLKGNLMGARAGLVDSGFCEEADIEAAISELNETAQRDCASSQFAWNRASAIR